MENHGIGSLVSLGTRLLQWCGKLKPALPRCLVLIAREEMVGDRNKGTRDIMGFRGGLSLEGISQCGSWIAVW